MSLKRNITANFLGQGWTALMGVAFIPVYIRYLGIESYGLIGIFALLQAGLTIFDLGITPALSREMARFTGSKHDSQSIRNLLRSVELMGGLTAFAVAIVICALSGWLAEHWLRVEKLSVHTISSAICVMGFVAASRSVENIYRSSLVGLQRQIVVNIVISISATFRSLGAVAILMWIAPTIDAFFLWQGVVSFLTVLSMATILYKGLPKARQKARFSKSALLAIWRFAGGIMIITVLSFLLMQTDKILLSRLLTLESFGYYSLAAMLANLLLLLVAPIDLAFFPKFAADAAKGDQASLTHAFHLGSQLVTVLAGSAAIVLVMFGDQFLILWTKDVELAYRLSPLLSLMSIGTLLNCLMHMPYQLQLGHGWTTLTIKSNIFGVIVLVPAIFWLVPIYGAAAAAMIWLTLNCLYFLVVAAIMFNVLLVDEKWRWYVSDIFLPLFFGCVAAFGMRFLLPVAQQPIAQIFSLSICLLIVFVSTALAASMVRKIIFSKIKIFTAA